MDWLAFKLLGPLGADRPSRLFNTRSPRYLRSLVPRGFAFVSVDARGTGASFGSRGVDFSPRERLDFAEACRWARYQPWCDGWLASGGISCECCRYVARHGPLDLSVRFRRWHGCVGDGDGAGE